MARRWRPKDNLDRLVMEAQAEPVIDPPQAAEPELPQGYNFWMNRSSRPIFKSAFHAEKHEVRSIVDALSSTMPPTRKSRSYSMSDAILMVICFVSLNLAIMRLAAMFGTNYSKADRILQKFIPMMADRADILWGPKGALSEADWASFPFNPEAVAAIDSTPLRVLDCPCSRYLRKALWCAKHHETAWKLTAAVAPNGICVWRGPLVFGRRNDKRAVDESGAPQAFLIVTSDTPGSWCEVYLSALFDMGYPGIDAYWDTAIMKKRPAGVPG